MNSSKKRLFIMLAVVVVMGGLLLLLNTDCSPRGDNDTGDDHNHIGGYVSASDESETLLVSRTSDELESLVFVNSHGTYHIRRGDDGLLDIDELSGLPLEEDFIELAWFAALSVSYTGRLTPDGDLASPASFGLDNPRATITSYYTDGTSFRIFIGDLLADQEGRYYFRVEGDDSVYVTDFNLAFFQGDTYWLSDDFFGDAHEAPEISAVDISGASLGYPVRVYSNPASEKWQRWYGYKYIINENGEEYPADDYVCRLFIEELENMVADEAVCAHPTAEQKTSYLMDTPGLIIKHKRNGTERTIRISKYDYSKSYAMVDGIDVIYELTSDTYPTLSAMTVDSLRSPDVLKLYFETVKRFSVSSEKGTYSYELNRTPMGGSDYELYEYSVKSSGGGATLTNYKALLEVFNSAQATEFLPESDIGELSPALTVNVEFFDERRPSEEICCYPAGNRRYRYTINGKGTGIVTQLWLDKFIADAQTADSGGDVIP